MKISIQRLIDIFESSLGKDRLDNLTPRLNIERVNLVHILHCAIKLATSAYGDYQIIFDSDPHGDIHISGDEKLLVTVFNNILENAYKYSNPVQITISRNLWTAGNLPPPEQ